MSGKKIAAGVSLIIMGAFLGACANKPFATFHIPIDPSLVGSRSLDLAGEVAATGDHGNTVTISVIDHENSNQKNTIGRVVLTKERPEGEIHGSYDRQSFIAVCKFEMDIENEFMVEICATKINGIPWKTLAFHQTPEDDSGE